VTLACALAPACTDGPTTPSASAPAVGAGQWDGMTSQNAEIAFIISADETVTAITIGYNFNGCSGSRTFSNLSVRTAPDVTCIPGPCSNAVTSYRAFNYLDGSFGAPRTVLNGLFLPGNRAQGQVAFFDYPGCGTATGVSWSAARR
jgi:hypothetical protein